MTQEQMATMFGKGRSTITEHINNIFKEGELQENMVCREFRQTTQYGAIEGKTQDKLIKHYNLNIWATQRLRDYIIKGFALNDKRFKTGSSMNYFHELLDRA